MIRDKVQMSSRYCQYYCGIGIFFMVGQSETSVQLASNRMSVLPSEN